MFLPDIVDFFVQLCYFLVFRLKIIFKLGNFGLKDGFAHFFNLQDSYFLFFLHVDSNLLFFVFLNFSLQILIFLSFLIKFIVQFQSLFPEDDHFLFEILNAVIR